MRGLGADKANPSRHEGDVKRARDAGAIARSIRTKALWLVAVIGLLGGCALYRRALDDVPRQVTFTLYRGSF